MWDLDSAHNLQCTLKIAVIITVDIIVSLFGIILITFVESISWILSSDKNRVRVTLYYTIFPFSHSYSIQVATLNLETYTIWIMVMVLTA